MKNARQTKVDADPTLPGPYDPAEEADDLWFLPGDADDPESPDPWPQTPPQSLVDGAAWREAEAGLAPDLADLAYDAGRLGERLAATGTGMAQRIALAEASSLSWWTGDRITSDRLALWLSYRIGATEEDGGALIRAAWAARRLVLPAEAGPAGVLASTLGEVERADTRLWEDTAVAMQAVQGCSQVTQGCALFHLWKALEERPDHLRALEAAVLGARLVGQARAKGGLAFLPLSLTGFAALTASGAPDRRLAAWISGAHHAVLAALLTVDSIAAWRDRAKAATADLSGRTPQRLLAALASHPMLGAAQAQAETGASRAAVQRNLDVFLSRGLVREVTGQGRFRIWAAAV